VHEQLFDLTAAKDLDGLLEHIAPDIVSYEHAGPLQHIGTDTSARYAGAASSRHPGGSISTFPISRFK